jgi:hypothetical protein
LELSEAFAPSDGSTITASCTDPTAASFTPDQTITVTVSNPVAAAFDCSLLSYSVALTGPVNSDSNPSLQSTTCSSGRVIGEWTHPKSKVAGLQCQSGVSATSIAVNGDATNNTAIDVKISHEAVAYASATQVDQDTTVRNIYGTSGIVSSSNITDGSGDADSVVNGEIQIGGSGTNADIFVDLDFTNYNLSGDSEALTYTYTPL